MMLKFFRNIRRRLLESGKVQNYLLYALGEIILVVIGILIALQINNWNIDNSNKRTLRQYYAQLQAEFKQLAAHETNQLAISNLILKKTKDCMAVMQEAELQKIEEFKDCLPYINETKMNRPQYPIFQEFFNEGWMSKMPNGALKDSLVNVRAKLLILEEMDGVISKKYEEWTSIFFAKNINTTELPHISDYQKYLVVGGPPTDFAALMKNMELWGMIQERYAVRSYTAKAQEEIIALLNNTANLLAQAPK